MPKGGVSGNGGRVCGVMCAPRGWIFIRTRCVTVAPHSHEWFRNSAIGVHPCRSVIVLAGTQRESTTDDDSVIWDVMDGGRSLDAVRRKDEEESLCIGCVLGFVEREC